MAWRQHAAIQSRGQHFPVDKTIGTPPSAERVNHDIDVVQKNDQRPKASQPIERQNTTLAHGHRYPLFNSKNRANSILPLVLQFHKQQ